MNKKNVISFINMKGGVGKTTLCREMATFMSSYSIGDKKEKYKILVIDIDPQSNLTQALDIKYDLKIADKINSQNKKEKEDKVIPSIQNIFTPPEIGNIFECSAIKISNELSLVPGELKTIFLERSQTSNTFNKLLDFIVDNQLCKKFDFIFIDCPPTYSIYTQMSLFCSDFYFIPVIPDAYSGLGVDLLEKVISDIIYDNRNTVFKDKTIKNLGIIFTRVDLSSKPRQQSHIDALHELDIVKKNDINIFKNHFNESNKISTANFDTLIIDRNDTKLTNMMHDICLEFINTWEDMVNESKE